MDLEPHLAGIEATYRALALDAMGPMARLAAARRLSRRGWPATVPTCGWPARSAGWLPRLAAAVLVVVGRPGPSDLAFLGRGLYSSELFPLNLILSPRWPWRLRAAVPAVALGEVALLRSRPRHAARPSMRGA